MKRPLILVCGGGHCKSVIEAAESAGFAIKGILDVAERIGDDVLGYKIVGTDDDAALYAAECDFVVTLGFIKSSAVRNHIIDKLTAAGCRFATVVASTAHVSRHATLGEGTVVLQHRRQRGARCDGGRRRARVDRSDAQRRVACGRRGVCGQRRGACSMCRRGCRQRDRCRQRGDSQFDRTGNLCRQSGTTNQ